MRRDCTSPDLYLKFLQAPETNWELVVDNFDHEGFYLPDQKAFNTLLGIYGRACEVLIFMRRKQLCGVIKFEY